MIQYEVCYYYVDNNPNFKFDSLEQAEKFAKQISREFHYYPAIKVVANVLSK